MRVSLNDLKTMISISISDKACSGCHTVVKEDELQSWLNEDSDQIITERLLQQTSKTIA